MIIEYCSSSRRVSREEDPAGEILNDYFNVPVEIYMMNGDEEKNLDGPSHHIGKFVTQNKIELSILEIRNNIDFLRRGTTEPRKRRLATDPSKLGPSKKRREKASHPVSNLRYDSVVHWLVKSR
ncbi:hypothetical protein NPIL_168871 [Nephila pilipes]|uniref:Uncharacterized protein n=1 Tax=Nephila pilipes TaxID=299642 RepID=A0A8X6PYS0_NEPPI|nr:hypothetical protein NPIL_168871 [Nephila pilipes]